MNLLLRTRGSRDHALSHLLANKAPTGTVKLPECAETPTPTRYYSTVAVVGLDYSSASRSVP